VSTEILIMTKDHREKLRVIQGGHYFEIPHRLYRIVAAPEEKPPFDVDAVVYEEDTYLVLSADPQVREPKDHPVKIMTKLIETTPETLGSVLVRGRYPLRFLAIIHDFNQEPTWREEWIASALNGVFKEAETRKLTSVALPMLGCVHGSLDRQRFFGLLRIAITQSQQRHLKRIWLITLPGTGYKSLKVLTSEFTR
jgi:hypothetical protein